MIRLSKLKGTGTRAGDAPIDFGMASKHWLLIQRGTTMHSFLKRSSTLLFFALAALPLAAQNYSLKGSIAIPGDGFWDYSTADSDARRLYVSHGTEGAVVDLDSHAVVGTIPKTNGVHGIAVAPDLGKGYISAGRDNTVVVFDLKTLATLTTITVGQNPDGILYEPVTHRVFTFNGRSNDSSVIDTSTNKVVETVPMGGKPEFPVADGKGFVFVNIEDKNEILHFNASTPSKVDHISLGDCDEPSGLAMDRVGRRLFPVCGNNQMPVVDADSGKVVKKVKIGNGPDAAAWDPGTKLAFSSNGQDGTLTVIKQDSPDKYTVVQTVPTQRSARTMAVDLKTHTVYLPAAEFGPAPAATADNPHPRPKMVPGSFKLLIVSQ
jgi:YVTN family beta-propeller protein